MNVVQIANKLSEDSSVEKRLSQELANLEGKEVPIPVKEKIETPSIKETRDSLRASYCRFKNKEKLAKRKKEVECLSAANARKCRAKHKKRKK